MHSVVPGAEVLGGNGCGSAVHWQGGRAGRISAELYRNRQCRVVTSVVVASGEGCISAYRVVNVTGALVPPGMVPRAKVQGCAGCRSSTCVLGAVVRAG